MQYAYGMKMRGFSVGCQPKEGFLECVNDISGTFYDILIYSRKLSKKEETKYELLYLCEIDE